MNLNSRSTRSRLRRGTDKVTRRPRPSTKKTAQLSSASELAAIVQGSQQGFAKMWADLQDRLAVAFQGIKDPFKAQAAVLEQITRPGMPAWSIPAEMKAAIELLEGLRQLSTNPVIKAGASVHAGICELIKAIETTDLHTLQRDGLDSVAGTSALRNVRKRTAQRGAEELHKPHKELQKLAIALYDKGRAAGDWQNPNQATQPIFKALKESDIWKTYKSKGGGRKPLLSADTGPRTLYRWLLAYNKHRP